MSLMLMAVSGGADDRALLMNLSLLSRASRSQGEGLQICNLASKLLSPAGCTVADPPVAQPVPTRPPAWTSDWHGDEERGSGWTGNGAMQQRATDLLNTTSIRIHTFGLVMGAQASKPEASDPAAQQEKISVGRLRVELGGACRRHGLLTRDQLLFGIAAQPVDAQQDQRRNGWSCRWGW